MNFLIDRAIEKARESIARKVTERAMNEALVFGFTWRCADAGCFAYAVPHEHLDEGAYLIDPSLLAFPVERP